LKELTVCKNRLVLLEFRLMDSVLPEYGRRKLDPVLMLPNSSCQRRFLGTAFPQAGWRRRAGERPFIIANVHEGATHDQRVDKLAASGY
jgi:hypothetical protein